MNLGGDIRMGEFHINSGTSTFEACFKVWRVELKQLSLVRHMTDRVGGVLLHYGRWLRHKLVNFPYDYHVGRDIFAW